MESYTYRADGSLVSKIDRNNVNHSFSYDEFGRLITKTAGTKTQSSKGLKQLESLSDKNYLSINVILSLYSILYDDSDFRTVVKEETKNRADEE